MASIVTERRLEIGIRMAIGAHSPDIARLVLERALQLGGAGLAIGLVAALAFASLLKGLVFGIGTADLPTLASASALLLISALAAAAWPAVRAARTSPMIALRAE